MELLQDPAVHLMDYKDHLSSRDMEHELARFIRAAREGGEAIALLVGQESGPATHQPNCRELPGEGASGTELY